MQIVKTFISDQNIFQQTNINIETFQTIMGAHLQFYVGGQLAHLQEFDKGTLLALGPENTQNTLQWKELIRAGIPDNYKRQTILQYFDLKSQDCQIKY